MQVKILREAGYEEAVRGMAYSYHDREIPVEEWWSEEQFCKSQKRATLLSGKGGGHDKFLRQIMLWVDIEAARCWFSEFDTYKVGTVAQSESTMHKLSKRPPTENDFEEGTSWRVIEAFKQVWEDSRGDVTTLKMNLPEGFLQRRIVTMNYAILQNIIAQRTGHRLKWWDVFINEIKSQVEHPELL